MHHFDALSVSTYDFVNGDYRFIADTIGDGPVCLFVHGLGEGRYYWRSIITEPRLMGRRLAYDLAGHGDAPHHPGGQYPLAKYTDDLIALLYQFSDVPVVIVGHSMGGQIALRAAATHSGNLRGLILVDCAFRHEPAIEENLRLELETTQKGFRTRAEFTEWLVARRPLVAKEIRAIITSEALRSDAVTGFRLKRDPGVFLSRLNHPDEEQINWDALAQVRCPILILRGEASSYLTDPAARKMSLHAQSASLQSVPRAGHGIPIENPTSFLGAIIPFLSANLWNSVDTMRVRE